uniref:Uncharacterized protein n=4 Tax=Schistocephalus solidus TaxID=70667 RepID=A0A0X3PJU1_SCHSO
MHSLYRAREERVNAETQASTCELQKCVTKLLFMAGRLSSENCVTAVKKVLNTRLIWGFRYKNLQSLGQSLTSLHLAKLTIDTESIFTIVELIQVQMEKIGNYILSAVAALRNVQRAQRRQDTSDEDTDKHRKTNVEAIKISLECERQILACFKLGADQVLQALGSPVEAAFSTVTVDSIYTNTATIQASIHQLLEQSDHRTFGTELLLEEVKLIILQCTAVMKRIHSLSDGDVLPLASDKEPETASEPVISEVKQLPRDPTMLEEYSLVFSRMLDFISESVNRKKQLCDDFKELVDLLGETEPGISKKSPQSSQRSALSGSETAPCKLASSSNISRVLQALVEKLREERNMYVPQVMQEMISIRQLLQKLSIDLAGTQLQRAKVFIQLDQDLVTWVSAVLLKLCKIDEYASTTLIKDIEGRPGNRDEDTLQQARPGCSHKSNSTNCLKRQSAAQFREDKHSEYLPRLRSQADVVNCKNQLTERISLSNDVCTKYSSCFLGEKELANSIQLLQDSEADLTESMEQLAFLTEREGHLAGKVTQEVTETVETMDMEKKEDDELMHIITSRSLDSQETPCRAVTEFAKDQIREEKESLENLRVKISAIRSDTQQERQRLDDVRSQIEDRRCRLREVTDILLTKQLTIFGQSSSR